MQIASVEAVPVTVSLAKPVVMSHITVERSHNVLAKVTTDDGIVGWGEGVEATDLTGDTQEAIRAAIRIVGSKTYYRIQQRKSHDAPWETVTIDLAKA